MWIFFTLTLTLKKKKNLNDHLHAPVWFSICRYLLSRQLKGLKQGIKDHLIHHVLKSDMAIFSCSHWLPEGRKGAHAKAGFWAHLHTWHSEAATPCCWWGTWSAVSLHYLTMWHDEFVDLPSVYPTHYSPDCLAVTCSTLLDHLQITFHVYLIIIMIFCQICVHIQLC